MEKRGGFATKIGILMATVGSASVWAIYGDFHTKRVEMVVLPFCWYIF